jgi:hypothetical protein
MWLIIKDCCTSMVNNETSWRVGRRRELYQPSQFHGQATKKPFVSLISGWSSFFSTAIGAVGYGRPAVPTDRTAAELSPRARRSRSNRKPRLAF